MIKSCCQIENMYRLNDWQKLCLGMYFIQISIQYSLIRYSLHFWKISPSRTTSVYCIWFNVWLYTSLFQEWQCVMATFFKPLPFIYGCRWVNDFTTIWHSRNIQQQYFNLHFAILHDSWSVVDTVTPVGSINSNGSLLKGNVFRMVGTIL